MGGVVQVLTRDPEFFSETWQNEARMYATFNSADTSVVGHLDAAGGKAGTALSGGVTWQDFGDRTIGGGATLSPTSYSVLAGNVKWRQALTLV